MKILFFGTPAVAAPFLAHLLERETVTGVVCKADEPAGRGYEIKSPPVKLAAQKASIPVFQPTGPWQSSQLESLRSLGAEVGIVVAYGRIMPRDVFQIPHHGCLNIHFSMLPRYRGAAPIQWALVNGETQTGVSAFWLDEGMDTGPLFAQRAVSIAAEDDVVSLREKLVGAGLLLLDEVLNRLAAGKETREPQKGPASLAPRLTKEMGRIDWKLPAVRLGNLIRGIVEWPGASTLYPTPAGPRQLKILKAKAESGNGKMEPGAIVEPRKGVGFSVRAGEGQLLALEVQAEGKKPMPAWSFWQGARLKVGDQLG